MHLGIYPSRSSPTNSAEETTFLQGVDGGALNPENARLVVTTADESKTLYEILKVEKKDPPK